MRISFPEITARNVMAPVRAARWRGSATTCRFRTEPACRFTVPSRRPAWLTATLPQVRQLAATIPTRDGAHGPTGQGGAGASRGRARGPEVGVAGLVARPMPHVTMIRANQRRAPNLCRARLLGPSRIG